MLGYQLLKNHGGILLCGDYTSLKSLHQVIHEVNEASVIIQDKEGSFLGLAYDARKAYEGQRSVLQAPQHYKEIGVRYGVEILWPVLLVQSRMLRASLAFFDSTKRQQAVAYSLECVIEEAVKEDFKGHSEIILQRWNQIDPVNPWVEQKLNSRGAQFCAWSKTERQSMFAGLLSSFDPMYDFNYEHWVAAGVKGLVSPETLDALANAEWVDPKC